MGGASGELPDQQRDAQHQHDKRQNADDPA
jgi:hypothetical protein